MNRPNMNLGFFKKMLALELTGGRDFWHLSRLVFLLVLNRW